LILLRCRICLSCCSMNWSTVLAAGGFPPVSLKVFNGEISVSVVGDGPAFIGVECFEDRDLFSASGACDPVLVVELIWVLKVCAWHGVAHLFSLYGFFVCPLSSAVSCPSCQARAAISWTECSTRALSWVLRKSRAGSMCWV